MRTLESLFGEYSESHRNSLNLKLHKFCVPAITWSLLGFLHTIPVHDAFRASHLFAAFALTYYLQFKKPLITVLILLSVVVMFLTFPLIPNLRWVSLAVFALAWVGQFYGHHVEGKKPSFLKDVFFLLIGPIWVINRLLPASLRVKEDVSY